MLSYAPRAAKCSAIRCASGSPSGEKAEGVNRLINRHTGTAQCFAANLSRLFQQLRLQREIDDFRYPQSGPQQMRGKRQAGMINTGRGTMGAAPRYPSRLTQATRHATNRYHHRQPSPKTGCKPGTIRVAVCHFPSRKTTAFTAPAAEPPACRDVL